MRDNEKHLKGIVSLAHANITQLRKDNYELKEEVAKLRVKLRYVEKTSPMARKVKKLTERLSAINEELKSVKRENRYLRSRTNKADLLVSYLEGFSDTLSIKNIAKYLGLKHVTVEKLSKGVNKWR